MSIGVSEIGVPQELWLRRGRQRRKSMEHEREIPTVCRQASFACSNFCPWKWMWSTVVLLLPLGAFGMWDRNYEIREWDKLIGDTEMWKWDTGTWKRRDVSYKNKDTWENTIFEVLKVRLGYTLRDFKSLKGRSKLLVGKHFFW